MYSWCKIEKIFIYQNLLTGRFKYTIFIFHLRVFEYSSNINKKLKRLYNNHLN